MNSANNFPCNDFGTATFYVLELMILCAFRWYIFNLAMISFLNPKCKFLFRLFDKIYCVAWIRAEWIKQAFYWSYDNKMGRKRQTKKLFQKAKKKIRRERRDALRLTKNILDNNKENTTIQSKKLIMTIIIGIYVKILLVCRIAFSVYVIQIVAQCEIYVCIGMCV